MDCHNLFNSVSSFGISNYGKEYPRGDLSSVFFVGDQLRSEKYTFTLWQQGDVIEEEYDYEPNADCNKTSPGPGKIQLNLGHKLKKNSRRKNISNILLHLLPLHFFCRKPTTLFTFFLSFFSMVHSSRCEDVLIN